MTQELYNASVRVRDLPRTIWHDLGEIAARDSKHLWEVVRDALIEYVKRHKQDD